MAIKIQITAEDKATPVVNKAFDNTKKKSAETANAVGGKFREVFENVTQNATGSFGTVASGLFKIPGLAGLAVGAILGIVGALGAMALKSAQATASSNRDSAQFLATIEKLKSGIGSVVDFIGSAVIPVFNALAKAFGVAASEQEVLLAQSKAYHDSIIANVKSTGEFIGKIKEFLEATDRLTETTIIRDYFKAFADGNTRLATAYQNQLTQLKILQAGRKAVADDSKKQAADETKNLENIQRISQEIAEERIAWSARIFENQQENDRRTIETAREIALEREQLVREQANIIDQTEFESNQKRMAQLRAQLDAQRLIGQQIFVNISQSLAAAVFEGEKLSKVLENILKQLATRALARLIFGGLSSLLGGGIFGGLGRIFGGFQHGGEFTVGGVPGIDQNLVAFRATRGERVTIAPANQSTVNNVTNNSAPSISINVNARNFDRNFVRTELVPLLNREVKSGLDLFASKIK